MDDKLEPVKNNMFINRLKIGDKTVDKVEFARQFTSSIDNCDFNVLDLSAQIDKIIRFIDNVNR